MRKRNNGAKIQKSNEVYLHGPYVYFGGKMKREKHMPKFHECSVRHFFMTVAVSLLCAACPRSDASSMPPDAGPMWQPGTTYFTERAPNARGFLDRKGLIHAHSAYSHDACDGAPVDENGERDLVCLQDFRDGLCAAKHDFVFLTDHSDSFANTPFENALLHQEEAGDRWIFRDDEPVASWASCAGGHQSLMMAGNEGALMPVGLERHIATQDGGNDLYGQNTSEARAAMRDAGAIILQAHTERFDANGIIDQELDGFEMYNLHANTMSNTGIALELLLRNREGDPNLPAPDLFVLSFLAPDPRYLDTWGQVAFRGHRHVTTMGTDCHRNTFKATLSDGERGDSYRRMMIWLSNHLLIRPNADGSWDDQNAREALRAGRLYGAFEVFGAPTGFDFHYQAEERAFEMGEETAWLPTGEFFARRPFLMKLPDDVSPPAVSMRLLQADAAGWHLVAASDAEELRYVPNESGVFRLEVWIQPAHLEKWMGADDWNVVGREHVWVYSNPIFLR